MQFYSTKNKHHVVSLKEAVLNGLPPDGGLYMPVEYPKLPHQFLKSLKSMTFHEIAFEIAKKLLKSSLPPTMLKIIIDDAFNFDAPLVNLDERLSVLELFHGPTLAFKDFAARFMSRLMAYFVKESNLELTILTATSGDTGSAVAHGYHQMDGINVIVLYPRGMVSALQEKQLTTLRDNIVTLEIKGTFDDCQQLVKQAFLDPDLSSGLNLTSANSINVARLIPQCLYYFYAYGQISSEEIPVVISVPSGNFGNIMAGLMAKKMGLPIFKFVAAVNKNDSVINYLNSGIFSPKHTIKTISNAMDVGNPSNFRRILDMYSHNQTYIRNDISGFSFSDEQTKEAIKHVYQKYKYILDPHGAVGYLGLTEFMKTQSYDLQGIFLETAHPAKFADIVRDIIAQEIKIPDRVLRSVNKEKKSILLSNKFEEFKQYLLALD